MEIRNDLSASMRTQGVRVSPTDAQNSAPAAIQQEASYTPSPDMRDMSNAMMILQTANAVVQQALNVSNKLRTMAQSTMMTGNTNMQELAQSIAGINSSLQQQGASIIAPVIQEAPKVRDTARIDDELASMERMTKAGKVDKEQSETVYDSLIRKQEEIKQRIDASAQKMGAAGFNYEAAPARTADLAKSIAGNYSSALSAQGNIRVESAGIVLG